MQWRASDVWCTMFLTIFLLFFGLVDSEKEDACSARCLRLHQRSIQRIDLSSDSLKALLEKKEPREQLKDTCWRTYDYFDCMKHCDHVPIEFEKFQRYVTKQCKEVMTDMDSSLRCVSKYHFFIEFRCSSFMKEAIRLRERIGRQYTPDEETCRYLHLNALCLETAVVKHCPEAKKIFRRLNFRDYFLNFILPEDDATFDDQDLDSCQVYDFVKKAMVLPTSTEEVYASTLPWSSTEELFSPSVTTEEIEADTTTLMDTTTSIDTTTTLIEEELQKLKEKQSIVPDEQLRNETEADEEIQTIDRELALLDQNIAHDDMTNMEKNLRELTSTEQSGEKEKDTIDIRPSTLRVSSDSHTTDTTSPVTDTEPTTLNRSIRSTTPKQRTTSPRRITVHRKTKLTRLPDGSIRTTTNDKEELAFTTSAGVVGELMSASIMSSTQKSVPPVLHAPTLSDELMDDLDPELLLPSNEKWWDNDSDEEKKKEKAREKEEHTTAREIDLPTSRPVRILHSETSTPILIEKEGDHFGADILLLPPANHEDRADDVTATIQSITPASTLSIDEELESTIEQLFATPAEQKTSTQPTKTKNAKFFDEVITSTTVLTSTTSESSITPMDKGVMELENLEPEETSSYKEITVPTESSRRKLFSSDEDFDITPNFHYSTYKIGLIPHDRDRYTYQPMETTTSDNSHTTSLAVSSEIEETTSLTPTKVMKKHKDKKEKKERKNKKNKNSREQLENKSTEIFIPKETQSRNGIPTSTTIVVASRESDSEVVSSSPTKTGTSMDATTTSQTTFLRPNRIFVKQILPKHALYVDDNPEHGRSPLSTIFLPILKRLPQRVATAISEQEQSLHVSVSTVLHLDGVPNDNSTNKTVYTVVQNGGAPNVADSTLPSMDIDVNVTLFMERAGTSSPDTSNEDTLSELELDKATVVPQLPQLPVDNKSNNGSNEPQGNYVPQDGDEDKRAPDDDYHHYYITPMKELEEIPVTETTISVMMSEDEPEPEINMVELDEHRISEAFRKEGRGNVDSGIPIQPKALIEIEKIHQSELNKALEELPEPAPEIDGQPSSLNGHAAAYTQEVDDPRANPHRFDLLLVSSICLTLSLLLCVLVSMIVCHKKAYYAEFALQEEHIEV